MQNIYRSLLLIALPLLLTIQMAHTMTFDQVEILDVGPLARAIYIDRGSLDGLKQSDELFFVKKLPDGKLQISSKGELVLDFPDKSIVVLQKNGAMKFKKGDRFLVTTSAKLLAGRRKFEVRSKIINSTATSPYNKTTDGIPDSIITGGENFKAGPLIVPPKSLDDSDIVVTEVQKVDDDKVATTKVNLPADRVRQQELAQIADEILNGMVQKFNGLPFGQLQLYKESEKDSTTLMSVNNLIPSISEDRLKDEHKRRDLDLATLNKIDREGDLWSASIPESDLRQYMIASGIAQEATARYLALTQKKGHELYCKVSSGITKKVSAPDSPESGSDKSFRLGYEFYLMKTSPNLQRLSIALEGGMFKNSYNAGLINVNSSEIRYGLDLLFYFYGNPAEINRYLGYLGVGFKQGSATITASTLTTEYDYSVDTSPSMKLGVKYRFTAGDEREVLLPYGIGMHIETEYVNNLLSAKTTLSDNINQRLNSTIVSLNIGLNIYF